jgi:hypothetical protein
MWQLFELCWHTPSLIWARWGQLAQVRLVPVAVLFDSRGHGRGGYKTNENVPYIYIYIYIYYMVVSCLLGSAGSAPPSHRVPKVVDDHRQPIDDHRRPIDDHRRPLKPGGDPSTTFETRGWTHRRPSTTHRRPWTMAMTPDDPPTSWPRPPLKHVKHV